MRMWSSIGTSGGRSAAEAKHRSVCRASHLIRVRGNTMAVPSCHTSHSRWNRNQAATTLATHAWRSSSSYAVAIRFSQPALPGAPARTRRASLAQAAEQYERCDLSSSFPQGRSRRSRRSGSVTD